MSQNPVLYIVACPKSGSTWLGHLLAEAIPGFRYFHPETFLYKGPGKHVNITAPVLEELQPGNMVVRAHTPASPENVRVMNQRFGKYVLSVRDLRDVAVSLYHHLITYPQSAFIDRGIPWNLPWQPLSPEVHKLDDEARMDVIIDQLLPDITRFVDAWLDIVDAQDNIYLSRYESITQNPDVEMQRLLDFCEITVSDADRQRALETYSKFNMVKGRKKFRKGAIGDWQDELTPAQKKRCYRLVGETMKRLGYT